MNLLPKKILVADGSAVIRSIEKDIVLSSSSLKVGAEAKDFCDVLKLISQEKFDGIILDSEIVKNYLIEEGKIFNNLKDIFLECKNLKIPAVVFVSSQEFADKGLTENLYSGISVLTKPAFTSLSNKNVAELSESLEKEFINLSQKFLFKNNMDSLSIKKIEPQKKFGSVKAIFIGVSTGGPASLLSLLKNLGEQCSVPVFITQHVDSAFDKKLIEWLDSNVSLHVKLAENSEVAVSNTVYFAPADFHLVVNKNCFNQIVINLNDDEPVNFLRPSIDKMFESAAKVFENNCIAVLLTGMGSDGAKGCCEIKSKGGYTITEAEESCAVYGMPKAAFEAGGSTEVLPLNKIPERIISLMEEFK